LAGALAGAFLAGALAGAFLVTDFLGAAFLAMERTSEKNSNYIKFLKLAPRMSFF
jgi:hypothetical protein